MVYVFYGGLGLNGGSQGKRAYVDMFLTQNLLETENECQILVYPVNCEV